MEKAILRKISKTAKVDFLNKLQTGKYELAEIYTPAPNLSFDFIPESGLYLCKENGKTMSKEEIECLPGYQILIELVSDKLQVNHEKPPDGFVLMPYSREQYLDSLLKNPSDKFLTSEEAKELLNDLDNGNFEKVRM